MRRSETWEPTNIIPTSTGWEANKEYIAPWSYHVTSLECPAYVACLKEYVHGDLLDVGAGTMPYYGIYHQLTNTITGLDWSESPHDTSHADVVSDANNGLPFAKDAFDTVLLADVLEHIYNPRELISDIARVLRKNGTLITFVPFMYGLHEVPHDYHRYTEFELKHLCHTNGLQVVHLQPFGGGPDVVVDLIEKMGHETARYNKIAKKIVPIITSSKKFKAARSKYENRFPIGYTLVATKSN